MTDRLLAFFLLCLVAGVPVAATVLTGSSTLLSFVFFYPLCMSVIWMTGGIYFWFHWERRWSWRPLPAPALTGQPLVSILIPCFNEAAHGEDAILAALNQNYPALEVIAINDGSTDATGALLDRLAYLYPALRVVHLAQNQGKAMALRMGAMAARSDYLVCIDGDACLAPDALRYLVAPLLNHPHIGAVTGNPRVRTRSTLVGRIQVGEFSSILGLIKRTQRVYGQVFTVSGVCTAFRREALDQVGYWSLDMITEDIDITWKLQRAHWRVFFEPRALCWILMPETIKGLWKQRLRWARGGAEVFIKNIGSIWRWRHRHLWPLVLDYCLSTVWSFALALSLLLWAAGTLTAMPPQLQVSRMVSPDTAGLLLATTCVVQFTVSVLIDRRYEERLFGSLYWIVWYPLLYWLINFTTTLVSFPCVMLRARRQRARWISPDRGIKELT
jgi:biofilm PGA synthesis N-glycosyltransferase PgaC